MKYTSYKKTLKTIKKDIIKDIKDIVKKIKFSNWIELDEPIVILSHEFHKISYLITKITKKMIFTEFDCGDSEYENTIKYEDLEIKELLEILKILEQDKISYD